MPELPTGTVTFLLSDVEGSTALWEEAAEAMRPALARHDELFERVVAQHGGIHIRPRGEGDSRFAVFVGAMDAVEGALALQRALDAEAWPTPRPIRVRIGVHTGQAQPRDDDYYGSAVNRCARIRGLGHGGQVLLSEATAVLVRDDLPDGTALVDHGVHQLKGLTRPERVFQVTAPDRPDGEPPLVSEDAHPNNLPVLTTALIGRADELARIRTLLVEHGTRLLTLTGPGGSGKTSLALHAGTSLLDQFPDGVFFVDLAPISDPASIASTIGPVLGIAERGERLPDELKRFVQTRLMLLILDNFEQVLAGAVLVSELLAASAGLKILVTSRAALQVRPEHELSVPPLALPDLAESTHPDEIQQFGAVALFVERAQAVRADFQVTADNAQAVATICTRLDGLPLALELAAARIRLLPPEAMVRRLEQRLPLLTGGARDLPERQRTLRDTIAWSYDLLDESEQRVFRALSVFVGGFTLDAAERVASCELRVASEAPASPPLSVLDVVERLVARSLVRPVDGTSDEPRFGMLETIREFGLDMLDASGEGDAIRRRHLHWYLELAQAQAAPNFDQIQEAWNQRLEEEHDNVRSALGWSLAAPETAEIGAQVAGILGTSFWSLRGHQYEARRWLARFLARVTSRSRGRAIALHSEAYLAMRQRDYDAAIPAYEESVEILRDINDGPRLARVLRHYGMMPGHLLPTDKAYAMFDESITILRESGDLSGSSMTLHNLGDFEREQGADGRAMAAYTESLALARASGNRHAEAYALRGLGDMTRKRGEYARAERYLREALTLLLPLRDRRCAPVALEGLACITVGPGWAERAARLLGASDAIQGRTGARSAPASDADYARTVADARAALGEARFTAVWDAGAAMSLEEAIGYALAVREPAQAGAMTATASAGRPAAVPLSARELDVVRLIAQGRSNREIAEQLVLSVRTVERHIENVYNRLGIRGKAGRAIITAYALRHELLETG